MFKMKTEFFRLRDNANVSMDLGFEEFQERLFEFNFSKNKTPISLHSPLVKRFTQDFVRK